MFQFLEPEIDREFVDAVMAFANLERIEDFDLLWFHKHELEVDGGDPFWHPPGARITQESIHAEFRGEQERLVKMLDKIIAFGGANDAVKRQLATDVQAINLVGTACFRRGQFAVFVRPPRMTVRQWRAAVIAMLVENGLDKRIGRCKECTKFFVGWPGTRGKRPQIFCGRPCLDAYKQRAYRGRKRGSK
jgi:hypothetical protein